MLAAHTTTGVGGECKRLEHVHSTHQLKQSLRRHDASLALLGRGSNTLVPDNGLRGTHVIIPSMTDVQWCKRTESNRDASVRAGAGVDIRSLAVQAANKGLSGLEFAAGIPGSVGGCVALNAGTRDGNIASIVSSVCVLDAVCNSERVVHSDELEDCFGYRSSCLSFASGKIVLWAEFLLQPNEHAKLKLRHELARRRQSQPCMSTRTPGCVFTNPPSGAPAARLIDSCGLKGYSIGGARVSNCHANFIECYDGCTATDVNMLIQHVQRTVRKIHGIQLSEEISRLDKDAKAFERQVK